MDDHIPIDIHSKKLMEWLITRRHCKRDWSENVMTIRRKIKNAIQDMPENDEIIQLLSGSYINYFHCLRIVDILKETESASKNFFGWYSSQRMKDWVEIVKLYEKDNVYLAEVAQMLTRNVYYEVPALKDMIAKCSQSIEDSEKDEVKCMKNAKAMKENYKSACSELGVKGNDIKKELLGTVKELSPLLDNLAEKMKNVKEACEFYHAFKEYSLNRGHKAVESSTPLLNCIFNKGNITVYELRRGKPPLRIENTTAEDTVVTTENNAELEIDFGDSDTIDFGDDGIDFGDTPLVETDNSVTELEPEVAIKEEALSILEYTKTRNEILNELYEVRVACELESFLELRLMEMKMEENFLSMIQFESAPETVQCQTHETISSMKVSIKECILAMDNQKVQHFLLIKSSPRYVKRLVDPLQHKLRMAEKMASSQPSFVEKRKKAAEEIASLKPKLELIIQKTKLLQKDVESAISKKYNGKPVNLIGDVNIGDFAAKNIK